MAGQDSEACAVQQAVQNASHVVLNSSGEQSFAKVPGGADSLVDCRVMQRSKGNEPSLLPKFIRKYSPLKPGNLKTFHC